MSSDPGTPERADTPHGAGMPDVSVTPHGPGMPDVSVTPGEAETPPAPPPPMPEARRPPRIPEPPPGRRESSGGPGFGSYIWSQPALLAVLIVFGVVVIGAVVDGIAGDSLPGGSNSSGSPTLEPTSEGGTPPTASPTVVADFDFAVIGTTGSASRGWTMEELDALPKRTVTAGGETVEGPSLLDLLDQSGEGNWKIVALVRTPVVPLERASIDEDWILLFEPGVPRLTLVNPRFPRPAWFAQIVQFNIVE